ncbi:hypothetical protein [Paremcibacter congregatus]|nr:hypothetical protein [Paremcibacter congregatus]|tara:strand:+ start:640 stop:789 length:150 start_codon:yes stop_codon:yes gene_type:complete
MEDTPTLWTRLGQSVKGHLKVAGIAVVFGMTAYGGVHLLIWVVDNFKNM